MKNTTLIYFVFLSGLLLTLLNNCKKEAAAPTFTYGTVSDNDGNVYRTITIGTQVWMAENLKTTKYRNGDAIPNVTVNSSWKALTTGAYCWYNNDAATYKADYGALYNWYAVSDSRNISPVGWHVPTKAEWTLLTDYLGGISVAGGKLKETGTSHWLTPNTDATNSSGFAALPGGSRFYSAGAFADLGNYGGWWSNDVTGTWIAELYSGYASIIANQDFAQDGFSVRCVRD